jgi:hypothetical protein
MSQLFHAKATSSILEESFSAVSKHYKILIRHEEADLVAKGTKLLASIQTELLEKYGTRQERAASAKRQKVQ